MLALPLRLRPGQNLRRALEDTLVAQGMRAGFVVSGMGSLRPVVLRMAAAQAVWQIDDEVELLTLAGSLGQDDGIGNSHLHSSVSLPDGRVVGGHVAYGCIVRTTAEVLLARLPGWSFSRETDPDTGWAELVTRQLG